MLSPASRSRSAVNIWPGFVDALASVLLVFIFMLLIFVIAQFFLADLASNRFGAIEQLSGNVVALLDELSVEKERGDTLDARMQALSDELARSRDSQQRLSSDLAAARDAIATRTRDISSLEQDVATLREEAERKERSLGALRQHSLSLFEQVRRRDESLGEAQRIGSKAREQVERLNTQVGDLRDRLAQISAALEVSEERNARFKVEVSELGQKLNIALAERVEELGRFRSDFFGRLREVLGDRSDIRIIGDRFVFQSEVLFPSGADTLQPAGRLQLDRLAKTLKEVAARIPSDVDWILRVDGHTDRRPIRTADFPSNWELSSARALSIVRHLIDSGIPPRRLAATGFGEFRPVDTGDSEEALARNRRIELKITGP